MNRARAENLYSARRARGECVSCGAPAFRRLNGTPAARCDKHLRQVAESVRNTKAKETGARALGKRSTLAQMEDRLRRVLELADGTRTMSEVADEVGINHALLVHTLHRPGAKGAMFAAAAHGRRGRFSPDPDDEPEPDESLPRCGCGLLLPCADHDDREAA